MELKRNKNTACRLKSDSKWAVRAAAWMGLSFFLRMVYYFALVNLLDLPGMELVFCVILPLIISAAFILMLKMPKLTTTLNVGILAAVFSVNYFFTEPVNLGSILSGILVLVMSGLIVAVVLGYVPPCKWLLWAGFAALGFRLLFVDIVGYILPLSEFRIIAWIPRASNLFGVAAVACLCSALNDQ